VKFFEVVTGKRLHISKVNRVVLLTIGADILVDEFGFALQNTHAFSVEPILTFVTADVEPLEMWNVRKTKTKSWLEAYCAWSYGVRHKQNSSWVSFARSHSGQTKSVISFEASSEMPTHSPWNQLLQRSQPM
jgi:hypothetical protein